MVPEETQFCDNIADPGGLGSRRTGLYRQFFRMISNAYRHATAALRADIAYAVLLLGGAAIGVATSAPAIVTLIFMCLGAIASGLVSSRLMWRHERWNVQATPRVWRGIAAVGIWPAAGTVAYWAYNQGYNYLIAGTVSLTAVAALASTRTLMMPITLLSTGVSPLMLTTASDGLTEHGVKSTLRRVTLAAAAMAGLALCYAAVFWPLRDFIFTRILHKSFAQRDLLLVVWWLASIAMVTRDQFGNFLLARARYRSLTGLTVTSAVIALTVTCIMIGRIGAAGAAIGVLVGEVTNVLGLITLSRLEVRSSLKTNGEVQEIRASGIEFTHRHGCFQCRWLGTLGSIALGRPEPLEESGKESQRITDAGTAALLLPESWP